MILNWFSSILPYVFILIQTLFWFLFSFSLVFTYFRNYYFPKRKLHTKDKRVTIGIFHPYANAGGGGEKVLWIVVKTLELLANKYPIDVVLYTGDEEPIEKILLKTKELFHVSIDINVLPIKKIYLSNRYLIEPKRYPHFTLILQSLASIPVAFNGLSHFVPDIFLDTIGIAFPYPLVKLLCGSAIITYTHYPTISVDMLKSVQNQSITVNNNNTIAKSSFLSKIKVIYYRLFASLYGFVGRYADLVLVNSTYTKTNLDTIWKIPSKILMLYPPCDIDEFQKIPLGNRQNIILSIGQFRPEKDHMKQLKAFRHFIDNNMDARDYKLVLLGGARNSEDYERVEKLKKTVMSMDLKQNVIFEVNASYETLLHYMTISKIGLHTMYKEHFGISIVEMMAAGLIIIAHRSGGPLYDIVVPAFPIENILSPMGVNSNNIEEKSPIVDPVDTKKDVPDQHLSKDGLTYNKSIITQNGCGFLADTVLEYSTCMDYIYNNPDIYTFITENARNNLKKFSNDAFVHEFMKLIVPYLKSTY